MGDLLTNKTTIDTTRTTGTAERKAALSMASDIPGTHRVTIGADKGDDCRKFVDDLRRLNVTPHVAQKVKDSAIDSRTHLAGNLGTALYMEPAEEINIQPEPPLTLSFRDAVSEYQVKLIQSALKRNDGNWAAAARDLEMNRSNLHNLATRLGIRTKK